MADPRDRAYAELIVEGCLGVQPAGRCSSVGTRRLGRCSRRCAARSRGAVHTRCCGSRSKDSSRSRSSWVANAPLELLAQPAGVIVHELETDRRAALRLGSRQHARVRGDPERAHGRAPGGVPARHRADDEPRHSLGRLPVPDRGARAGGRPQHRGVRRASLRRGAARLGCRGRADARDLRAFRRRLGGADRGRGHRSASLARGALDEGRRARREPAGRRVLRLPGRGLGRGRDLVRRVPRRLSRARDHRDPARLRGGPCRRRIGRRRTRRT